MKPDMRTNQQNKLMHSIIAQIAAQTKIHGSRWSAESFKRFLIDQWAHENGETDSVSKVVPSIDGQRVVQLGLQSRRFTKEQAISFTEWLLYWASTNGVTIDDVSKT